MGLFTVPQIGAGVWIEYESGDPDYPIWVGGYWTLGETPDLVPVAAPPSAAMTLQSPNGNGIVISDAPGEGILIQGPGGAKISITNQGITIDNGQGAVITLNHNTVSLNGSALTVT